ncbi:MAG TPA: ribosome biogenesis GTPase YlqF [Oscillospiraceae bacterium]|nr:ribosome biogenesis GTPase YlqF [Oscillospiraceae bacterium]
MNINWYPGHMKKTKKLLREQLKLIDVACELLDARIPLSSKNPDLDQIMGDKPKIIIFNKIDLADPQITSEWVEYFKSQQKIAVPVNSITGNGIRQVMEECRKATKVKIDTLMKKGRRPGSIRIMIVGIPNVGKSSFINKLVGRRAAQIGDKPGVTKGKQWIRLKGNMDLLDTPGILWPKIEDPAVALNLAFIGAIKDGIIDTEILAYKLLEILWADHKEKIIKRYKLENEYDTIVEPMDCIAKNRGCILKGNKIDYFRISNIILDEFRSAKIGRISLEYP